MNLKEKLKIAIEASIDAGKEIMKIYEEKDFQVEKKSDESPITIADKRANDIIRNCLSTTQFPIISEESKMLPFKTRSLWKTCWIVDPLDGTKEFIKRNGEFTVNIALVEEGYPILGVIYVPASGVLYAGVVKEKLALKVPVKKVKDIDSFFLEDYKMSYKPHSDKIRVVGSRSHPSDEMVHFVQELKKENLKEVEIIPVGSSLKFCMVAEGLADIYPRFGPTMEWDTAAGQAICEAVGLEVADLKTGKRILYNRENSVNNSFLVSALV